MGRLEQRAGNSKGCETGEFRSITGRGGVTDKSVFVGQNSLLSRGLWPQTAMAAGRNLPSKKLI
jgi:hypothetical protein